MAATESNVAIYDVIIQLDGKYDELKAGMPADVTIIVEQKENVLTVSKRGRYLCGEQPENHGKHGKQSEPEWRRRG